jgi:hypothetical protein
MNAPVKTNVGAGIGIVMWTKPGWLLVHIINAAGRSPLDEVMVQADIELEVMRPAGGL